MRAFVAFMFTLFVSFSAIAAEPPAFDQRVAKVLAGNGETTRELCDGKFDKNFKYGPWSANRTWAEVTRKLLTGAVKDADQRRRVLDELRRRTGTATVSNAELPDAVQAVYGKFAWNRIGGFCGAGRDSTPALRFLQAIRAELSETDPAYADEVFDQLVK